MSMSILEGIGVFALTFAAGYIVTAVLYKINRNKERERPYDKYYDIQLIDPNTGSTAKLNESLPLTFKLPRKIDRFLTDNHGQTKLRLLNGMTGESSIRSLDMLIEGLNDKLSRKSKHRRAMKDIRDILIEFHALAQLQPNAIWYVK